MKLELEQQVTSLEISKRLKELGVKQESLYTWIKNFHTNDPWKIGDHVDINNNESAISTRQEPWYVIGPSAFTVAELGEMLPDSRGTIDVLIYKVLGVFAWQIKRGSQTLWASQEDTEANARGKMLIYLLENKLITNV